MSIGAELGQYILQTQLKKLRFNGGQFERPLWVRRRAHQNKATARMDSRLKLTIGKLVSKSTHHL